MCSTNVNLKYKIGVSTKRHIETWISLPLSCDGYITKLTSRNVFLFQLLKCLLSGLFTNCAWLRGGSAGASGGRYVTASGSAAALHPGGVLHSIRPPPPAVLYTELLQTKRIYLVTVSVVQPQWLHQVAPDYARRCRANRWRKKFRFYHSYRRSLLRTKLFKGILHFSRRECNAK